MQLDSHIQELELLDSLLERGNLRVLVLVGNLHNILQVLEQGREWEQEQSEQILERLQNEPLSKFYLIPFLYT